MDGRNDDSLPSNNQVRRAGDVVRARLRGEPQVTEEDYIRAIGIIEVHRAAHAMPMLGANVALRRYCRALGIRATVTQRLKRMETIKEKLTIRQTGLALDRMQDLGGCRAVVPTVEDVYRLKDRLVRYHPDARITDYVNSPRESGYRAVHVVAAWGRAPRKKVEIQLRSELMHTWADMVEGVSGSLGVNYKQDAGASDFQAWARTLSSWFCLIESGEPVPEALRQEYSERLANLLSDDEEGGNHVQA